MAKLGIREALTKEDKAILKNEQEETKMTKKTLSKVISIISILFIFSSISYAATASEWVNAHNNRRYWHGAPNVVWDNALAAQAKFDAPAAPP